MSMPMSDALQLCRFDDQVLEVMKVAGERIYNVRRFMQARIEDSNHSFRDYHKSTGGFKYRYDAIRETNTIRNAIKIVQEEIMTIRKCKVHLKTHDVRPFLWDYDIPEESNVVSGGEINTQIDAHPRNVFDYASELSGQMFIILNDENRLNDEERAKRYREKVKRLREKYDNNFRYDMIRKTDKLSKLANGFIGMYNDLLRKGFRGVNGSPFRVPGDTSCSDNNLIELKYKIEMVKVPIWHYRNVTTILSRIVHNENINFTEEDVLDYLQKAENSYENMLFLIDFNI